MRWQLKILLSVCVIGGLSCSDALTTPDGAALISTDSATYTAVATGFSQVQVRVVATFTNPSDHADTLATCFPNVPQPMYGVELVAPANDDGSGYNPTWACAGHDHPMATVGKLSGPV